MRDLIVAVPDHCLSFYFKHLLQPNWFNEDISETSKKRDYFKKIDDTENFKFSKQGQDLDCRIKTNFLFKEINDNKRNPRQLWKNLHDLTNKSPCHENPIIKDLNGEPVLGPEKTANIFNDYFISVFEQYAQIVTVNKDTAVTN